MSLDSPISAFVLSLIISLLIGTPVIKMIQRAGAGQSIREDGPKEHLKKSGTPTIGGLIFIISALAALIITGNLTNNAIPVLSMLGFGLIGFIDDFIKVVLKRNLGLTAKQKIFGQLIVSLLIGLLVYNTVGNTVIIPFVKTEVSMGIFYIPFAMLVMIATSNSANLTDGLDGLATTVTIVILGAFALIAKNMESASTVIFALAMLGGCLGFLRVNRNPARIFMGDTGSMALGGAVVGIAMVLKLEFLIPVIGIIYFLESVSVIIQVMYYKKTKKRFFRMAPYHHHLEAGGRTENQIVMIFGAVTLIASVIGYFAAV